MLKLPAYASIGQRIGWWAFLGFCALVFLFLVAPLIAIVPLSFNQSTFLTYPMPGVSLRWYEAFFSSAPWQLSIRNTFIVGICAAVLATTLGTLASLGMAQARFPMRALVMALVVSPMVVPFVITALGMFFFFSQLGLTNSLTGLILAHTALGVPFVVITVSATLQGFDRNLLRAAASLGAKPFYAFRRVTLPVIAPGVTVGALFAFATSFDEVVVAVFLVGPAQRTLPRQMFSGIRENIDPTIAAAATFMMLISVFLLIAVELLRRRSERLRGLRK
jgi:putative spermidine/putrescine transport system permease protein